MQASQSKGKLLGKAKMNSKLLRHVNLRQKEKENWAWRILFRHKSSQLPKPKSLYIHTLCTLAKGPLDDGIYREFCNL
jgi:hypothetical protein